MEAPEKLYLHPTAKGKVGASWLTFKLTNEDIEYIRKDTFIEEAADKLKQLMYGQHLFKGMMYQDAIIDNFIENFKKYIKGE